MNKLVLIFLAFFLALAAAARPRECDAVDCPIGTRCVETPQKCQSLPCPQYTCKAIRNNPCKARTCPRGELCLPEPKFCIRAPCPQYSCLTPEDYICATAECPEGTTCKAQNNICKKAPCPQYVCEVDHCAGNPCNEETEICLASPRMCIREPCPQYTCKDLSWCAMKCSMDYIPVCGSDGNTYTNACILQSTSCNTRTLINIIHDGECGNPVEPTEPVDACNRMCAMYYSPVCGTDGKTYGNHCLLGVASCKDDSIAFAYEGECVKNCDIACPRHWAPVCGTNGVTYGNACMLNAAACKDDSIAMAHEGECEKNCDTACTKIYDPVCGTDGVTYGNECMLSVATCKDDSITLAHPGECNPVNPCALVDCGPNRFCLADPKQCITTPCDQFVCIDASECGRMCPMIYAPVCGTDGNTYSNACMLKNASCDQSKVINVAHNGECGSEM